MANSNSKLFSLRNLTEGIGKGAENLVTEMIAKLGGKGAASLTMKLLVDVARDNEALAKRIYELLRASETVAIFTAGSLEGLLPSIEKMEGTLGNFARVFRSFGVNLFERTFPHYFNQLKELADGENFDGFRAKLGEMFSETADAMTGGTDTVLEAQVGHIKIAFKNESNSQFLAWRMAVEKDGYEVVVIKAGQPVPTAAGTQNRIYAVEVKMDDALNDPNVVFDPISFRELNWGMTHNISGAAGKKSVYEELSDEEMKNAGIAMKAVIADDIAKGRKPIATMDQIDQIMGHCHDGRILEALAATVKSDGTVDVGLAKVWLQQAGSHASLERVMAQELSDLFGFAKMEISEIKRLAASGYDIAQKWLKKEKVAKRLWWHGKLSFWTFIGATLVYVASTIFPDWILPWWLRVAMLFISMVPAAYLVGYLLTVGWLAGLGRDTLNDVLGDIFRHVGKVLKIEEADEHLGTLESFERSKPMYWLGLSLGSFAAMAFALSLGLRLAEAVKHLHTVMSAAGVGLVMFLVIIIGGELYSGRVKRMFIGAMEGVQKDVLGGMLWWRILRAKPAITLVVVMPVAVGALFFINPPKIGQVGEAMVLFSDDGKVWLGDDVLENPNTVLGNGAEFVHKCSMGVAHVDYGVANIRKYVEPGADAMQSSWYEFRVDKITRVLYAVRMWTELLQVDTSVTVSGYVEQIVKLPNGETWPLLDLFSGATAEPNTNRVVVPCNRTYTRGTNGADFTAIEFDQDKRLCHIQATKRADSDQKAGVSVLKSVWSWLDAKAWWAYALLSLSLLVVGAGIACLAHKWTGLAIVGIALVFMLMAFAT